MEFPSKRSGLANLSPKASFIAGIGVMVAVFFVVGFFVLLSMVLSGKEALAPVVADINQPSGVQDAAQGAGQIQLAPVTGGDWARGNESARITVVEYSDIDCSYCHQFYPVLQRLASEYPNDVRWVYRHFPLDSIHPQARVKAEAAECAGAIGGQDGFWAFIDTLYENPASGNDLAAVASDAGIDEDAFSACVTENPYANKVQSQAIDAQRAGAQGTPYSVFVADGENIPLSGAASYEQVAQFIESALGK